MNYFAFFDLPEKLTIDLQDLEKRFYALSRKWHPDRFVRASADQQQQALDSSAILNDAYRTLRNPVARAEYLLDSKGLTTFDSKADSKKVPPELLEEVFELNIALEELKAGDQESVPQLRQAQSRFLAMLETSDSDLESDFRAWDDSSSPEILQHIRGRLNHRKYISNLVLETGKALENYVSD